jgi:hypothetical protein
MSLQSIHKYVDECDPCFVQIQGETDLMEDDPCNPESFTPQLTKAYLDSTNKPIHLTTKGCWPVNLMVDNFTLRFDPNNYPTHENIRYGSEAIVEVRHEEDIESWLYCADEKLDYIRTWLKAKKGYDTTEMIKDYILTEGIKGLRWHADTLQI